MNDHICKQRAWQSIYDKWLCWSNYVPAVHLVCFLGICLVSRSQFWAVDSIMFRSGHMCDSTFGLGLARLVEEGGRVGHAVVGKRCGRI